MTKTFWRGWVVYTHTPTPYVMGWPLHKKDVENSGITLPNKKDVENSGITLPTDNTYCATL